MTSAPARANSLTAAAPMPLEPPVISAAFPASEIMSPPCSDSRNRRAVGPELRFRGGDLAGSPCSGNQLREQAVGQGVAAHALWMPLNAHDPIGVARPFHAFH